MRGRGKPSVRQSLLLYAILIPVTLATIYPILVVISVSLRPSDALYSTSLRLIPDGATLKAYWVILFEKSFLLWMRNSLIVSLAVTIFGVAVASTAGYAFSRFRFPGRKAGMVGLLVTQMFPATMLLVPLYVLMRRMGLVDTMLGLVIAYTATVQTEWANYSAGSLLVCIPVVALFLILNRFLVSGLTLGGVKG